jgi:hypothetical protein
MPLEAKRSRHVAVAIPEVRVSRVVAVSPRQQSTESQPDVAHRRAWAVRPYRRAFRLPGMPSAARRSGRRRPDAADILNLMLLTENDGQEPGKIGEREQNWDPLFDVR